MFIEIAKELVTQLTKQTVIPLVEVTSDGFDNLLFMDDDTVTFMGGESFNLMEQQS